MKSIYDCKLCIFEGSKANLTNSGLAYATSRMGYEPGKTTFLPARTKGPSIRKSLRAEFELSSQTTRKALDRAQHVALVEEIRALKPKARKKLFRMALNDSENPFIVSGKTCHRVYDQASQVKFISTRYDYKTLGQPSKFDLSIAQAAVDKIGLKVMSGKGGTGKNKGKNKGASFQDILLGIVNDTMETQGKQGKEAVTSLPAGSEHNYTQLLRAQGMRERETTQLKTMARHMAEISLRNRHSFYLVAKVSQREMNRYCLHNIDPSGLLLGRRIKGKNT